MHSSKQQKLFSSLRNEVLLTEININQQNSHYPNYLNYIQIVNIVVKNYAQVMVGYNSMQDYNVFASTIIINMLSTQTYFYNNLNKLFC